MTLCILAPAQQEASRSYKLTQIPADNTSWLRFYDGCCTVVCLCVCDRGSRCVVERKLVKYCMIERERESEIARKGETGRNPTPGRKHSISGTGRRRQRNTLPCLQMFSAETPEPEGTDLVCLSRLLSTCRYSGDVCAFVYVGTVLLYLFNI